jgi:hypothetical protein
LDTLEDIGTTTDEKIVFISIDNVVNEENPICHNNPDKIISNLPWLIAMCFDPQIAKLPLKISSFYD